MRNTILKSLLIPAIAILLLFVSSDQSVAQNGEPGWYPYVIARGQDRDFIRQTPIHLRPYRPLHVYGNVQRRIYYRGSALPSPFSYRQSNRTRFASGRIFLR